MRVKAAAYARFSTDKQSEASIPDQFRLCDRLAERNGFRVVAQFEDAAISGGTTARPGYQAMLSAARRGEFDVIIAEDTSRLWRNMAEQAPRMAELRDLGIHVVCHDLDTRQESSAVLGAVLGAMGEGYRQDIGRRTRRGLEGRARAQKPTGGRAYGYIAASDSASGEREVHPEQAAVVVRIFEMYRDGFSPRAIADRLNVERVPSPGSTWNRKQRRRSGWLSSAIAGDASRGVGILNNEAYAGRIIWNRHRWVRSASDSKRRRCIPNPPSEWITHIDERLRIVPEALWLAVKARQRQQAETIGQRVSEGMARKSAIRTGRGPKFLLSGLLKCADCGSAFVVASATGYACASYVNGGAAACANSTRFRRDHAEQAILDKVKEYAARPDRTAEVLRRVRARLREATRPRPEAQARLATLSMEIDNLVAAVAAGGLRGSSAIAERLRAAEAEREAIQSQAAPAPMATVERLLPDLAARHAAMLENLPALAARDVPKARAVLASHVGVLTVEPMEHEIGFFRQSDHAEVALLQAVGATAKNCGSGGRLWLYLCPGRAARSVPAGLAQAPAPGPQLRGNSLGPTSRSLLRPTHRAPKGAEAGPSDQKGMSSSKSALSAAFRSGVPSFSTTPGFSGSVSSFKPSTSRLVHDSGKKLAQAITASRRCRSSSLIALTMASQHRRT